MSVGSDIKTEIKKVSGWTWVYGGIAIAAIVVIFLLVYRKVPIPGEYLEYQHIQKQTDSTLKLARTYVADSVRKKVVDSFLNESKNKDEKVQTIYKNSEKIIYLYRDISKDSIRRLYARRNYQP